MSELMHNIRAYTFLAVAPWISLCDYYSWLWFVVSGVRHGFPAASAA